MRYQPPLPSEARELNEAHGSWRKLRDVVNRFLSLPAVQQALVDEEYRQKEFPHGGRAEFFHKAANHTQKALARDGDDEGMREMTVIQEWMNLLLEGRTLHSTYQALDFYVPERVQAVEGLTIHAVAAVMKQLHITRGPLDTGTMPLMDTQSKEFATLLANGPTANPDDEIVTETHALHVIASHENAETQSRILDINPMGTHEQVRRGFNYGKPTPIQFHNRIQGAWFRWLQVREYCQSIMPELSAQRVWTPPESAVKTTIISDVCTGKALQEMTPTFGEAQWGFGPKVARLHTVDLKRGDIKRQLDFALPTLLPKIILHHPTDNPAVKA